MIEAAMAREGKIPSALWIFRSKNYLGMRDVQVLEAATTNSGDVPNNGDDIVATLPEAPEAIEIESEK